MIFRIPGLMVNVRKPEITDLGRIAQWLSSDEYLDNIGGTRGMESRFYEAQASRDASGQCR
jgi:hypothetical protein